MFKWYLFKKFLAKVLSESPGSSTYVFYDAAFLRGVLAAMDPEHY